MPLELYVRKVGLQKKRRRKKMEIGKFGCREKLRKISENANQEW